MLKTILLLAAIVTGLSSGLFYAYSCSVNPGLKKLDDPAYLQAMQEINRAILNPVFFLSFMGSLILLPVCTWMSYRDAGASTSFYFLISASLFYIIGTFGVTIAGNVPLNNMLDKFPINNSTLEDIRQMRTQFEMPWNRLHLVRTLANLASFILLLIGIIKHK